jgi:hypothetical protein
MLATETTREKYKSPKHKLIAFFERSRDSWKEKYDRTKMSLKLAKNQARAVEKSRVMWRERAGRSEQAAKEAIAQAAGFKAELEASKKRILNSK